MTTESTTPPAHPHKQPGFALWLRGVTRDLDLLSAAETLGIELTRHGAEVELIDAASLAHALYTRKQSGTAVALAVSMTVNALTRHGVACLILGGVGGARDMDWGRRKPERLLELLYLREGDVPSGNGPFVIVKPGGADTPPDPPPSAPVGDTTAPDLEQSIADHANAYATDEDPIRWDIVPVLDALGKAGWIDPSHGGGNGGDDLIRQRLKDLGYL